MNAPWLAGLRMGPYVALAVLCLGLAGARAAGTLEEGNRALARGDYAAAYERLLPFAESGNVTAQYNLGVMNEEGLGREPDLEAAFKWYGLAAERGDSDAQVRLGQLHEFGRGTPRDLPQAAALYRRSAEQGNVHGQTNLADMYLKGEGVERDLAQAARWLQKAAAQGHAHAQYVLGLMYADGAGVDKDLAAAERWLRAAASAGHEEAAKFFRSAAGGDFDSRVGAALRRLQDRPDGFVVIEHATSGKFVQFAASARRSLLFDVPHQTLSAGEADRAAAFFADRGFDAAYEAPTFDPRTGERVGVQRSFQVLLGPDIGVAVAIAGDFFSQVYGIEPRDGIRILEQ